MMKFILRTAVLVSLVTGAGVTLAPACSSKSTCEEFSNCYENPEVSAGAPSSVDAGMDASPQGGTSSGTIEAGGGGTTGSPMVDTGSPDSGPVANGPGGSGGAGGAADDAMESTPDGGAPEEPPETVVECTPGDTRPCSEAGLEGACALGTQTCTEEGLWSECSIQPEDGDTCDPGNDANCNGVPNDGCGCVQGAERSCSVSGALGNCAAGTQVCGTDGTWDACDIQAADEDSCDIIGDDADCDGIPNGNCDCTAGDVSPCGPPTDDGICEFGESHCIDGAPGECQNAVYAGSRDCTSSEDNDCDGVPDNTLDEVCKCTPGSTQTCGEHPGLDGNGPCQAGEQTCLAGPENLSSNWSPTCVGSVGPASQDLCNARGDDSNCDGDPNGNCACIAGDRTTCGEEHDSLGDCTSIMLTCGQKGTYPGASQCQASSAELCNSNNRDEDCDGQINENPPCDCTNGGTRTCGNCNLGTQACQNGQWQSCDGDDYTVEDCGPSCVDCTQPNATASCGGSQCQNTCVGQSLTQWNSACSGQNGKPACGSWDFETGTEGWSVTSLNDIDGDPESSPSAWDGTLTTSTSRKTSGSRSLAVGFDGNGSSDRWVVALSVQLCPGGQALDLRNRTLKMDIYAQTASGSTAFQTNQMPNYIVTWNGSNYVAGGCDFDPSTLPGFFTGTCQFNSDNAAVTDVTIALRVTPTWRGTLYMDNVRFQP